MSGVFLAASLGLFAASQLLKRSSSSSSASSSSKPASQQQLQPGQILTRYGDVEEDGNLRTTDWTRRWEKQHTGWHRTVPNKELVKWLEENGLAQKDSATAASSSSSLTTTSTSKGTILVPLCGKSVDLIYLYQQGFTVVGIEVVTQAIVDFFYDNSNVISKYSVEKVRDGMYRYSTPDGRLSIVQADIFSSHLTKEILLNSVDTQGFDYVWDRASIVAINPHQRAKYVSALERWSNNTSKSTYLLMTCEYDQNEMYGPPFSVEEELVHTLFSRWQRELVSQYPSEQDGGKGKKIWLQNKFYVMKRTPKQ